MGTVNLPYVDSELGHLASGEQHFWRHFHWGYFTRPEVSDDDPQRYLDAAQRLTERLLTTAEVTDGQRILDVGCGFGGTLDHIRGRNRGCRLVGVNIDERQLRQASRLLAEHGRTDAGPVSFATADGCQLPVGDRQVDQVLAVECIFHFPSRKRFFREAARVLRPGGRLTLSDFLVSPGSLPTVAATMGPVGVDEGSWYGRLTKPLTADGYARLARGTGFDLVVDDDITVNTLPTYPALRRLYRDGAATEGREGANRREGAGQGVATTDRLEQLSSAGHLRYRLLSFRSQAGPDQRRRARTR